MIMEVEHFHTQKSQVVRKRLKWNLFSFSVTTDGGKIPGAKHVSFEDLFADDGTMKSRDQLKARILILW